MARPGTLARRVLFYQVFRDGAPVRSRRTFDFAATFAEIGAMANDLAGRRLRESDEAAISCFVDSATTIRFGRIRSRNLPSRIEGERIDNIPLGRDGGLFEVTHLMYFDPGIIGAEFNFYAPRVSRLASYISAKTEVRNLEILPIVKGDSITDLERLDRLHRVHLKLATNALDGVRDRDRRRFNIFNRIDDAAQARGVASLTFTLESESGRNSPPLGTEVVNEVLALARLPNVNEVTDKFVVEGYRPDATRMEAIDVLSDELVGKRDFIQENLRSNTLNRESAYATIAEVFRQLEPRAYVE